MKQTLFFAISLLLFNCHSKPESEKTDNDEYPRKDRFIVSENERWLDSLEIEDEKKGLVTIRFIEGFDSVYSTGGIHFLIENNQDAYFFVKPFTKNSIVICGTNFFNKEDSLNQIEFEKKYLDSIQPISIDSVSSVLLKYKKQIKPNKNKTFPTMVSFALKNDTLNGSFMHDILKFMEENGMNAYFIRRMNENELNAVERFNN
jgi:hypothetical protein